MSELAAFPTIQQDSVTVVLPALNEEHNIRPAAERVIKALSNVVDDFEVIVINDGSTDRTGAVANELAQSHSSMRVLHNSRNMGLGYSYIRGYREATKKFFIYVPGDNTWPSESLNELFRHLGEADIITSYSTNPEVRPAGRQWVSSAYTAIINFLFSRRLAYYNGLTIYPVAFLRTEPTTTSGFGFQAEVLLKALAAGLSYVEIPLRIDERSAGKSRAVNLRNITSVFVTLCHLFYELRIRRSRVSAR
jgi:dolichol-phosphate mannosyltransferase